MGKGTMLVLALISGLSLTGCQLFESSHHDPFAAQGFVSLFNGKDLSGWKLTDEEDPGWKVEDGAIVCEPVENKPQAYLYTEGQYGDFILQVEYKVREDGANSGVFFRCNNTKSFPSSGFEVQVLGDYGNPPSQTTAGAIYGTMAPPANYSNPIGEWNRYEIIVFGRNIITFMNGHLLYHMPGMFRKVVVS